MNEWLPCGLRCAPPRARSPRLRRCPTSPLPRRLSAAAPLCHACQPQGPRERSASEMPPDRTHQHAPPPPLPPHPQQPQQEPPHSTAQRFSDAVHTGMPMSSVGPSHAPSLERGRACLTCRRRRVKCDGARPVCGRCAKSARAHGESVLHHLLRAVRTHADALHIPGIQTRSSATMTRSSRRPSRPRKGSRSLPSPQKSVRVQFSAP